MTKTINKSTFKQALEAYQDTNTTKRELAFFDHFFFLNESQGLPPDLQKKRGIALQKLQRKPELLEKYYVFHLIRTMEIKWGMVKAEDLVGHFYKSCPLIKQIWEEL